LGKKEIKKNFHKTKTRTGVADPCISVCLPAWLQIKWRMVLTFILP